MCGLLLLVTNDTYATRADDFVRDAFLANQVRGLDSSGIFQIKKDGEIATYKEATNASNFVELNEAKSLIREACRMPITVGHVRAATQGSISKENAHPFVITREDGTKLVGVHNGTLQGWKNKPHADKFQVDSEWAFHMLAHEGADAFEYFTGAFALIWHDTAHPNSLFMARNKDRPLCYMVDSTNKTMLGCSELGMLGWLSERNNFKLAKSGVYDTFFYLEEGKIYEFDINTIGSFKVVDYPAYDPRTTVATSTPTYTGMRQYPGTSAYASNWLEDGYDDDADWGPHYGSRTNVERDWNYETQESTLNDVKEVLRLVRSSPPNTSTVVQDDDDDELVDGVELEKAMTKALRSFENSREPDPIVPWTVPKMSVEAGSLFLTSTEGKSATRGEIAAAKSTGMYGMVVKFKGIEYDEENSTCVGYFDITKDGKTETFDGEIRFLTGSLSKDLYIDRDGYAVVVGMNVDAEWLVLERLTPTQYAFVRNEDLGVLQQAAAH